MKFFRRFCCDFIHFDEYLLYKTEKGWSIDKKTYIVFFVPLCKLGRVLHPLLYSGENDKRLEIYNTRGQYKA